MLSWNDLIRIEPRLVRVHRLAVDAHNDGLQWIDFWRQATPELAKLVGFRAKEPTLRSTRAYDVAQRHVNSIWAFGVGRCKTPSARPWNGPALPWTLDDAAKPMATA